MDARELGNALAAHTQALTSRGVDVEPAEIERAATPSDLDAVEGELGLRLPPTFRGTLGRVSRAVRWSWTAMSLQDGFDPIFPEPFEQIFGGHLEWSIDSLPQQHRRYLDWVHECFGDPQSPYDAVWHNKLGFHTVPNGDILAIDLDSEQPGAVVYLSHDDGQGHGYVLAASLMDLLDRWVPLACPGPEDWQWLPFVPYDSGPIDPAPNGVAWRGSPRTHGWTHPNAPQPRGR